MCANYRPVTRLDRLLTFFGVERSLDEPTPDEVYPLGLAPFIRLAEDGSGNKLVESGQFGLLPMFAKEIAYGRKTYNARAETVDKLASFRDSWAKSRRCVIPAEALYEICQESGMPVRWCIQLPGSVPVGIAGVYRLSEHFKDGKGNPLWTFAMLTVNADHHPVFSRMQPPDDEKRMPLILDPADYDHWLMCTPIEAKAMFRPWGVELEAFAAPREPAAKKPRPPPMPKPGDPQEGLF